MQRNATTPDQDRNLSPTNCCVVEAHTNSSKSISLEIDTASPTVNNSTPSTAPGAEHGVTEAVALPVFSELQIVPADVPVHQAPSEPAATTSKTIACELHVSHASFVSSDNVGASIESIADAHDDLKHVTPSQDDGAAALHVVPEQTHANNELQVQVRTQLATAEWAHTEFDAGADMTNVVSDADGRVLLANCETTENAVDGCHDDACTCAASAAKRARMSVV